MERLQFVSLAVDGADHGWVRGARRARSRQGRLGEAVAVDGLVDVSRARPAAAAAEEATGAIWAADLGASVLRAADSEHRREEERRVDPRRRHDDDDKGADLLVEW